MNNIFDTIIVITPSDFERLSSTYAHTVNTLPSDKLIFVGRNEIESLLSQLNLGNSVSFLNENDVIPFDDVHKCMQKRLAPLLNGQELPRKVTGWYYQQFIKMKYSSLSQNEYYMTWDGDTVPCGHFSMFKDETDQPYIDVKTEYHEDYFKTIETLLPGMHKCIGKSFISEHMLFNKEIMKNLIDQIEHNAEIEGTSFYEKIINSIPIEKLQSNSFSEFETYGTFLCFTNPSLYRIRDWHSFRMGGYFFNPNTISERDYTWLSKDFYAISFEKSHVMRDDYKNLFDNEEYQNKLSARQMLEIAQEEFEGGMKERWDDVCSPINTEEDQNPFPISINEIKQSLLNDVDFIGDLSDAMLKVCRIFGPSERIHLANEVCLENTLFNTMSGDIFIGQYTFSGQNVSILTGSHDTHKTGKDRMNFPIKGNDIHIGNGVWLGSNSTILGPCEIEDNAVIAAGSIVLPNTKIGKGELWAGVPAKFKKSII